MNIKIAFYKGQGNWLNKIIRWWTKSPYSHAELILPNNYTWIGMLLSQFLPFSIKRRNKWYCSEWIAYALRIANIVDWKTIKIYDRCDLSPGVLFNIVAEAKEDKLNLSNSK